MSNPSSSSGDKEERPTRPPSPTTPINNVSSGSSDGGQLAVIQAQIAALFALITEKRTSDPSLAVSNDPLIDHPTTPVTHTPTPITHSRRVLPPIPEGPRSTRLEPRSLVNVFQSPLPPRSSPSSAPVPPPVTSSTAVPAGVAPIATVSQGSTSVSSTDGVQVGRHRVKSVAPTKFKGTTQEMNAARSFLFAARQYLKEAARSGEPDDVLVDLFGSLLEGNALTWFMNLMGKAERENRMLTLAELFESFIDTYEPDNGPVLADIELSSMTYGVGQCKSLASTDNEFDRLAFVMTRGQVYNEATDLLLASRYQDVIRRGHFEMWEMATLSTPITLDQWKAAVRKAHAVLQTRAAVRGSSGRSNNNYHQRGPFHSSSSSSSSSSSKPAPTAVVQNVSTYGKGTVEPKETFERMEGEQEPVGQSEELQQIQAKANAKRRWNPHLTHPQRVKLQELKKCWICYEAGHMAGQCPNANKPGIPRKPTDADLN